MTMVLSMVAFVRIPTPMAIAMAMATVFMIMEMLMAAPTLYL